MAKNTVEVDDATFADLLKGDKPVLVDFWADWCAPCKMLAPVLDEIAGEYQDKITIAKIDVDANQATAQQYQVLALPTLIVFKNGERVKELRGARPKAALLKELEDYLS